MNECTVNNFEGIEGIKRDRKAGYRSVVRPITPDDSHDFEAQFVSLQPGQSFCPYHYHYRDEELFYIIRGEGELRTHSGVRHVQAGDVLFFPSGEGGAHKLTNASKTEEMVYIDLSSAHDPCLCFYPDSGKIGVYGMDFDGVYRESEKLGYYDGE